jgi:hypothetical protein
MNQFTDILIFYSLAVIVIGVIMRNFIIYPAIVRAVIEGLKEFENEKNAELSSKIDSNFFEPKKHTIERDYGDGLGIYVIFAIVIFVMAIAFFSYR